MDVIKLFHKQKKYSKFSEFLDNLDEFKEEQNDDRDSTNGPDDKPRSEDSEGDSSVKRSEQLFRISSESGQYEFILCFQ